MSIHNPIIEDETGPPANSALLSAPELELDKYRAMISEMQITEEEANELLKILWEIAATFARMGVGVDPVQVVFGERLIEAWREMQDSEDIDDVG